MIREANAIAGRMNRVVVTGGAGFIGSAFIWKLNREGINDILVVDSLGNGDKWKNLRSLRFSDYMPKDVFLDRVLTEKITFLPDAVIHMGACSSTTERDVGYLMENNYRYTQILANWTVSRNIRFLYASSAATYGDGIGGFSDRSDLSGLRALNPYGYSKHLFDLYAAGKGILEHIAGLKFFNVFGPNEYHKGSMTSVVFQAFRQIQNGGRVELFESHRPDCADGEQTRDFVYVKDCVEVMWWLLIHPGVNGLFNVGTGMDRSFQDLAMAVFTAMGRTPHIDYIPMPESLRENYQYHTRADSDGLRNAGCPLIFRSLEEAVRDYVLNHLQARDPYLCLSADGERHSLGGAHEMAM